MIDDDRTIERLFDYAIEIEYKAAQLYGIYSRLFSQVPGLSAYWQELKKEEMEHARILQESKTILPPEQLMQDPGNKLWSDLAEIHSRLVEDKTDSINNLDDAYELAHELEFSEVNSIFLFLITQHVPSDKRKFFTRSIIEQHQKKLLDFSRLFGGKEWRKSIKIKNSE